MMGHRGAGSVTATVALKKGVGVGTSSSWIGGLLALSEVGPGQLAPQNFRLPRKPIGH